MQRVLLVEDHALVRAGLRALLDAIAEIEVVSEACDGNEALRLIEELHPDVVLIDISMPGLNGIETIRRAAKLPRRPRFLVLTMHADREYVRGALLAGADGYLLKTADRTELVTALAAVGRGEELAQPIGRKDRDRRPGQPRRGAGCACPHAAPARGPAADHRGPVDERHRAPPACQHQDRRDASRQIMQRLDIHHVAGLVQYAIRAEDRIGEQTRPISGFP